MATLLSQVRDLITVDVDSMDPAVAARHTTDTFKFRDMTSNQAIVHGEAVKPESADILKAACDRVKNASADPEQQVSDALELLAVLLAKRVEPYLTGRVLVQTSPSAAYDVNKTVAQAERYVKLFEAEGIPRSRVTIKIPSTPESIVACQRLEKDGVHTLATCLFNLPQALAAHQAECTYIAPYFNELRVHFEPSTWKAYKDTFNEHPVIAIIGNIIEVYEKIGSKTLVMPASIVTIDETLALTALRPDHLTLSPPILDRLAEEPGVNVPARKIGATTSSEVLETDWLINDAQALKDAIAKDAEAARKLTDALSIFDSMEQKTKVLIREQLSS